MRIAGYCRVSTQEQAEHGYSIGEQEARIKSYCQAMGWALVKVYSDPGFSGAKIDRPGLQAMISDIKGGLIDAVLVYKLDRLSRSQKDALYLIEDVFLANSVDFVSISENFDTSTPLGRAMIGILAVFAQLEREQIKERMVLGKTARAKKGKWQGGNNTPIGYLYDKEKGLKLFEDEAVFVRLAFQMFTSGHTIAEIESTIYNQGGKHRYGLFTKVNINRLLGNPVYIGQLIYRGETYDAMHERLIDDETFYKAQEIRAKNHDDWQNKIRGSKNPSLLSGLLFCARCGGRYHHLTWQTGQNPRYVCYSRDKRLLNMVKDSNCKNKIWPENELNGLILDEVKKLVIDQTALKKAAEKKKQKHMDKTPELEKRLQRLRAQRSRYMDLYALEDIDIKTVSEKISELNRQIAAGEKELESERAESAQKTAPFRLLPDNIGQIIDHGTEAEKRAILRSLISRIDIDGDDIRISWKFS